MKYRADIDGLRALAVIPVVLFHANFLWFKGGFVGVDIFFVISGYLITKIIADEVKEGRFSIFNFYERRVRRIFPALFSVLFFSAAVGAVLLLPGDLAAMGNSLLAAVFFVSNLFFWKQSGYFLDAETKPLLHIWSLAVEEQFYVFFPIFLLLTWRYGRHWKILTWLGLIGSLAISIYGVRYFNIPTFFLLPSRAWELLCGAVIALGAVPTLSNQKLREVLAGGGLTMILAAVFFYDSSMLFPGESALLPCVGASLIIYAGLNNQQTIVSRLLSHKYPVFIGLISYSLYLWHWPLIVYSGYYNIDPLTTWQSIGVVIASGVAGYLSWKFIERPFRWKDGIFQTRRSIFLAGATVMILALCVGLLFHVSHGLSARVSSQVLQLEAASDHDEPCYRDSQYGEKGTCVFGPKNQKPEILVWGDSHAGALIPGVQQAADQTGKAVILTTMGACPGLLGVTDESYIPRAGCPDHNKRVMKIIADNKIKHVILVNRWGLYATGMQSDKADPNKPLVYITDAQTKKKSLAENKLVFTRGVEHTISELLKRNIRVTILSPIPVAPIEASSGLARAAMYGRFENYKDGIKRDAFNRHNQFAIDVLHDQQTKNGIDYVDIISDFCDEKSCRILDQGYPLYFDTNHISVYEAKKLTPVIAKVLMQ